MNGLRHRSAFKRKTMIVHKTSVLPASRKTVFEKLKKLETLQYIARPFATFEPVGETVAVWKAGSESSYCFRLFGFIPYGTYTIRIIRFDPDRISSQEGNEHVPVWNHDITLVSLDDSHTEYTDRVEICAGWKTVFVWLWANMFYAHRQRKWGRLLRNKGMDDKQKSKSYFNRHSSTIINRNGYWSYDYRITSKILIKRNVKNLIDIGCGNGAFLAMFYSLSPDTTIAGLDLSHEMVLRSRERLPEADITEGDAEKMPFEDGEFDAVSCHMSIHHQPHPEKSLAEMYRILEHNGTVVINELTGPKWLRKFMNWWFTKWPTGDHAVYSRAEMERMLRTAGFRNVHSRMVTPFSYVSVGRKTEEKPAMIKLTGLSDEQVSEISYRIADAFFDYEYNEEDIGLIKHISTREDMFTYMNAIVRVAYKSGVLYTTSERQEGYLMLSGEGAGGSIGFIDGMKMIMAEKKALGGFGDMKKFISACFCDGGTIETRMRKAKRRFLRIEMLVVRKEYQGQGFMRKMMEFSYHLADKKHVPVILDTDDKDKAARYEHLGMKLDRVRSCGERFHMYDLIRE